MILDISGLEIVYPDKTKAVDKFNLQMKNSESLALAGANGAGKTTLLLAIAGIVPVSKGCIQVDGIKLTKKTINDIRARVGLIFQNPDDQLFMTNVYNDIAFGPRNYGASEDEVKQRVEQALSELGITRLCNRSVLKLSAGEKRLAAIATVLSMRPAILLFDEPTAFLDLKARRNMIRLLNNMPYAKLIVSHDLHFLEETCERVVLMKDGSVFSGGITKEIFRNETLMEDCGLEGIT